MALIILRAVDLAAALLDGHFAYPAGDSDTDTARELIAAYDATIEFFRSLLDVDRDGDLFEGLLEHVGPLWGKGKFPPCCEYDRYSRRWVRSP